MSRNTIAILSAAAALGLSCLSSTCVLAYGSFNHIGNGSGAVGFSTQGTPAPQRSGPQRPPSHPCPGGGCTLGPKFNGIHGELPVFSGPPRPQW